MRCSTPRAKDFLDHFVSEREQRGRNGYTEHHDSFEVDD
jgi:hypothetical protein